METYIIRGHRIAARSLTQALMAADLLDKHVKPQPSPEAALPKDDTACQCGCSMSYGCTFSR